VPSSVTPRRESRHSRPAPTAVFTPRTLAFLRALERKQPPGVVHARKDRFEADVRAPMVALVERLAADFAHFAPDLVASPARLPLQAVRDTRFSADKAPLKTHIGAIFPHRLLPKHEGTGYYVEVAPRHVWYGGGMYMPSGPVLYQVREHIAAHHRRLARLVGAAAFRARSARSTANNCSVCPGGSRPIIRPPRS